MNFFPLLLLVVTLAFFSLASYIHKEYSGNQFHLRYIIMFIIIGFFSLFLFMLSNSSDKEEAIFWSRFLALSHMIFPLINDSLFHLFGQKWKPAKKFLPILLYIPFFIMFFIDIIAPSLTFSDPVMTRFGWMYVNKLSSPVYQAYNIVYSINVIFLIVFISIIYRKEHDKANKRFLTFFSFLLFLPFILFYLLNFLYKSSAEVIIPFMVITGLVSVTMILFFLYRYTFFDISLELAINDITANMTNLLFMLDKDSRILKVNQYVCKILSYTFDELFLKPFSDILFSEHYAAIPLDIQMTDANVLLKSKDNRFIPALLSISKVFRRKTFIAYTVIGTDVQKIKKLLDEKKFLQLELKALKAQMNPHFIFNALNSILLLISKNDEIRANTYITSLTNLIRKIMENVDKELIPVGEEMDLLKDYLSIESLRFDNSFTYSVDCKGTVDMNTPLIPPMILQPFVENAVWHGLLPMGQKEDKRVSIIFKSNGSKLEARIIDNGVGRAYTGKYAPVVKSHRSQGISNIRERIGLYNSFSESMHIGLQINDLKDKNNIPSGTEVKIIFDLVKSV